jgi:hypothetical protein
MIFSSSRPNICDGLLRRKHGGRGPRCRLMSSSRLRMHEENRRLAPDQHLTDQDVLSRRVGTGDQTQLDRRHATEITLSHTQPEANIGADLLAVAAPPSPPASSPASAPSPAGAPSPASPAAPAVIQRAAPASTPAAQPTGSTQAAAPQPSNAPKPA